MKQICIFIITLTLGFLMFAPKYSFAELGLDQAKSVATTSYGSEPSTDIPTIVGKVVRAVMGLIGVLFVILTIYAGFLWMTAGGEEGKTKTSKTLLVQAVIGMAIAFSAYAITSFVVKNIGEATK